MRERTARWLPKIVFLALAAVLVPAMAGTPRVSDTVWIGPTTFVLKVRGEGVKRIETTCGVTFDADGFFDWSCERGGTKGSAEHTGQTWTRHGKRIVVQTTDEFIRDVLFWVYEEVTGREDAVEASSLRARVRARMRPKRDDLKFKAKYRGKIVAEDGSVYRVRLVSKAKQMAREAGK